MMSDINLNKKRLFIRRLNKWYRDNKRDFPWRQFKDPYFISIAEVLLQKTNAEKVVPVFSKLIKEYADPNLLANENISTLKSYFLNIGLENKAETLKQLGLFYSQNHDSVSVEKLLKLKGVGIYITNSIIIHAKNKPLPLLDPNIIRIYSRVFNMKSDVTRPRTDKRLWQQSKLLLPAENISDYYYALLDFGAIICKSRNPRCEVCIMAPEVCDNN